MGHEDQTTIISFKSKEQVLSIMASMAGEHYVWKHPEEIAEYALAHNNETYKEWYDLSLVVAEEFMYAKWRKDFLSFGSMPEGDKREELNAERYFFLNTILCNMDD